MTDDAWDPEPASLREAADSDVSGHAARNIALLREAANEGAISRAAAAESIARIRRRDVEESYAEYVSEINAVDDRADNLHVPSRNRWVRRLKAPADDSEGDR